MQQKEFAVIILSTLMSKKTLEYSGTGKKTNKLVTWVRKTTDRAKRKMERVP